MGRVKGPRGRKDLNRLLDAARAHGRTSDPDHEVGDLQDILRSAWDLMTESQRKMVAEEHKDKLDWLEQEG